LLLLLLKPILMKKILIIISLFFVLFITSCEDDNSDDSSSSSSTSYENLAYFYENASSLKIDVAYEENAEPYINNGFGGDNNFLFTKNNISNLLSERSNNIAVLIDQELSEMTPIPAQNKSSYTQQDILAISETYQTVQSTENQGVIFLVYLDGYFSLNDEDQTGVLGVSVGSFTVAIFKPVISAIQDGGIFGSDPKYMVEQATATHEIGHAIGLVNNGVDLHTSHQDDDHGKHCSNTDCVMYWEIASSSGASGLLGGSSASVNELVFGQECIDDISNF